MWGLVAAIVMGVSGCGQSPSKTVADGAASKEVVLLALNDFHGNLQASRPTPYTAHRKNAAGVDEAVPAGGYAHVATAVKALRQRYPDHLVVGVGDLIGASPVDSALLEDQPTLAALGELGMSVSVIGNHELDKGARVFRDQIAGRCAERGCTWPGFAGARFDYIAANIIDKRTGRPWLPPYVIREVAGVRVAFVGAVTTSTPSLVAPNGVRDLEFEDEAVAINRLVPEIRRKGVHAIVALIHDGGMFRGAANDPTYRCDGFAGPIIDIAQRLDKAVSVVFSAHTHQAYTCRVGSHLVVQGQSYGAYVTAVRLAIDPASGAVTRAEAENHLVDQRAWPADPAAQALVEEVGRRVAPVRDRVVTQLPFALSRRAFEGFADSPLSGVIADAQAEFARQSGPVDFALMNAGGIRTDLVGNGAPSPKVTLGDVYACQPFGNEVVVMTLSGREVQALLAAQASADGGRGRLLLPSAGLTYTWTAGAGSSITDIRVNGQPLQAERDYRIAVNGYLAEGGDRYPGFRHGRDRVVVGKDADALAAYLARQGVKLTPPAGRIHVRE